MKSFLSRVMAILAAMTLMFTMAGISSVPVKAAGADQEATEGSITVTGIEEKDALISVYRIIKITVDDRGELNYEWTDAVKSWVETNYPAYKNPTNFSSAEAGSVLSEFYSKLASAILKNEVTLTAAGSKTADGSGSDTISNLNAGNYLILVDGKTRLYKAAAANVMPEKDALGTYTTTAGTALLSVKAQELIPDKRLVDEDGSQEENGVSIGDTVKWETTYDIPEYPDNVKDPEYYVYDIFPKSLRLVEDSIAISGLAEDGTATVLSADAYTKVTTVPEVTETPTFAYQFSYDKIKVYAKIQIKYDSVVTEEAEVYKTGENTAGLKYEQPSSGSEKKYGGDTTDKKVPEIYGAIIKKVDKSDTTILLAGAKFELSQNGKKISFVKLSDGVYKKAESNEKGVTTLDVGSTGNQKGLLKIQGLAAGTYTLTETEAPEGYNKLTSDVSIKIEAEKEDTDDGYTELEITNSKDFTLPSTGGMGTTLFTVSGILLMAAGFILFLRTKRNRAE